MLALLVALLLLPATAHAAWFPAAPLDGDVVTLGNIDLARDGSGAIAYLRADGGAAHAYAVRVLGGAWQRPERVDVAIPGAATEVAAAAGDGNRLAVAWISGGTVFADVVPGDGNSAFTGTVAIGGPNARSLDIDLGVNGAAYAVWEQDGDVRAARLQDTTWTPVAPPLDVDPGLQSGTGALRPKVAVGAEGYAVATWGDVAPGGTRVWARRITGLNLSVAPQLVGAAADSPDIDIEYDGSFAWVVYRQDTPAGSRSFARRLVGSQFEAPESIDAGLPSNAPRVDMNGSGRGYAVAQLSGGPQVIGSWLDHDHFQPPARMDSADSTLPTEPEVAASESDDVAMAWRTGLPDGNVVARARFKDAKTPLEAETTLSRPELGPVADPGVAIAGDRLGDFAVAMVQAGAARTLSVGLYDRPPGRPFLASSTRYERTTQPTLRWRAGVDLWGVQTFRVYVDSVLVGQVAGTDDFIPPAPLRPGRHGFQIEAVDQAGQAVRSRVRPLLIDTRKPRLRVRVTGARVPGVPLTVAVRVKDPGGAGVRRVRVDYGDRSRASHAATSRHRYRRGRFTVTVTARDRAGNVTRKHVKLRIGS